MKRQKISVLAVLVILISCIYTCSVVAASGGKKGTIEIKSEANVKIEYSKVGDIVNGEYILKKEYKKSGVNLNHLKYADELERAAKKLNKYMKTDGTVLTSESGTVKIENLSEGIYLIRCSDVPTLVTVPVWDETQKEFIYDMTVIPKLTGAEAPQTGVRSFVRPYLVITMALLMCAAMFSYKARQEYRPYRVSGEKRGKLREQVITCSESGPMGRKIDFEKLKAENPDICGWLYIPGTQIDDPVLIGGTDTEYLHKNFQGEKSVLGAVFGFCDTAKDFSDSHICLFGHNMSSNQMFGELKKYREASFIKEHSEIYLYTPQGVKVYQVFSVYDCEKNDYTFQHKMQRDSWEFLNILERMQENNIIEDKEKQELSGITQVLTLASCSDYRENANRLTVNGFLKEERK